MAAEPRIEREPNQRFLAALLLLAVVTRLAWVLWVHPPDDYVFSDMRKYVERAQRLASIGTESGIRELAWQAFGTHALLALPLRVFGTTNLTSAAILWGSMAAGAVPLSYLLARRVCMRHETAYAVGIGTLLWHPNLSNSGYFLSETPFLFFQLWSTYGLVCTFQDGRRAMQAGVASAFAFAVRPQSALFFGLAGLLWFVHRRKLPHVRLGHLLRIGLPLLAMLAFSLWRFERHTGYGPGIAENVNMNLTAGRCHNIVTQAFPTQARLEQSEREGNTRDGRRVSLPEYRVLAHVLPDDHFFALRPALASETIRFVGYIGDPEVHREIRWRCYEHTGWLEQVRYSLVNASLLWFVSYPWPEAERGRGTFFPAIEMYRHLFQVFILFPSLVGMGIGLASAGRRPAMALVALQLVTSIAVAAIFFGEIRLRTPYDPYSILLAAEIMATAWLFTRRERS